MGGNAGRIRSRRERGDPGEGDAEPLRRVRREDPRTARVRQDQEAIPPGERLHRESEGEVEEVLHRPRPEHPALPERRRVGAVGPREAAGVGGGGARSGGGGSRLHDDDRLAGRHAPGRAQEPAAVVDALHVPEDDPGRRIVGEELEDVRLRDVGLVPEAHELGEADVPPDGPVEHGGAEGAGLGEEGDEALRGGPAGERRVQRGVRVDQAEAVGPQHPDPRGRRHLAQGPLEGDPRPPDLLEPGGDDDPRAHPLRGEPGNPVEDGVRRDDEDAQVDVPRDRVDGRVQRAAEKLPAAGIHAEDLPREPGLHEVGEHPVPDLLRGARRPDDGDRSRMEQFARKHGPSPPRATSSPAPSPGSKARATASGRPRTGPPS